jgi:acyl carrier protein
VKERVIQVVAGVLDVSEQTLAPTSSPVTIDAWDSLRHMNLVLALEEEFGIRFNDERIMKMVTLSAILETVTELAPA